MIDHESALQKGLIACLRADGAITALLGEPARVWDEPEPDPVFPYLLIGSSQSRIPGDDFLTAYPAQGQRHDGGRRP